MKLEERLRELEVAEDLLHDGETLLRGALLKDRREFKEKEKLITEALFKVRGALPILRKIRIAGEMKQRRKRGGLGA